MAIHMHSGLPCYSRNCAIPAELPMSPPPSPPPASGRVWPEEAAYWTEDADGDPIIPNAIEGCVLTGDVSGGKSITVNAKEGITVGPDEVLVVVVDHMDPIEYAAVRAEIETALPRNRYLIFVGAWKLAKVHSVEVGPDGALREG
jgi:hypothetical protein